MGIKLANMPVYQLFGGKVRSGVPVYRHADGRDIDELCEFAITQLKSSGIAKAGDPIVIMAGSASGGAQITDTVRMVIVP